MKNKILLVLSVLFVIAGLAFAQPTNPPTGDSLPIGDPIGSEMFTAMFKQVANSPASLLVIVGLSIFAWLIEVSFVNSKIIPWFCVVGGACTYWLFSAKSSVPASFPYPAAVLVANGVICGFLSFLAHAGLLKWVNRGKALASVLLVASVLSFTPGCALFTQDSTVEQKATDVRNLAYTAASIGTAIAIEEQPELRPQFELAYANLDALVNSKVVSGLLLRDIVNSLPIKELKSPEARIAIDGATYLYTATVGDKVNIENQPYVVAAATGIRDGMKSALGK